MTAIHPKFVDAGGVELVVLTRAEYDALVSAAADAEEDAADAAIYDQRKAELANDPHGLLPPEVSAMMLRGDRLLKALRKWRDMTQMDLSSKTGIGQGYLSDIEAGRKSGTPETIAKIASALDVDPSWLTPASTVVGRR